MLTIIHGSDIAASRKFFQEEKKRFPDSTILLEDEVNLTHLSQILQGGGLFANSKAIFIEQFLTDRKKSAEKEAIIHYLVNEAKKCGVYLWEGKELTKTSLTPFIGSTIRSFKIASVLFTFLDDIKPRNGMRLVRLFQQALKTSEPEMILFMIVRQLRILLAMSETSADTITEVSRLAQWQKSKFEKQARLFDKNLLQKLYSSLFKIELAQKTGGLNTSLIYTIDFFLAEI